MHLALSLPWWLAIVLACFVGAFVFLEYRRPLAPLPRRQRAALAALRTLALAALMLFVFRPIALLPPRGSRDAVVPVLIDASRSMSLKDAGGLPRLLRAVSLLKTDLLPALSTKFKTELFAVGDALAPTTLDSVRAEST